MATECESVVAGRSCDVLAIGRCGTCSAAYCASHRYIDRTYDECWACGEERARILDETYGKPRRDADAARLRIRELSSGLDSVGPPTRVQLMKGVWKPAVLGNRWRPGKGQIVIVPDRVAWLVGEFMWMTFGGDFYGMCSTGVLNDGSVVGLNPVGSEKPYSISIHGGRLVNESDWTVVMEKVEKLIRSHLEDP
jgi:hypothetical protein